MSDEGEVKQEEKKSEVEPYVIVSGESRASVNWNMVDKFGIQHQITMREGMTAEGLGHLLSERSRLITGLIERGGYSARGAITPPPQTAPSVDSATAAAIETGKAILPPPAATPAPQQAQAGLLEFRIAKIEITPKPDNKSEVKFFMEGHKFPDIYATQTIDNLVKMFSPVGAWTDDHFKVAGNYAVKFTVCYVLSERLNSKGNPYKNITQLKP